MTENIVHTACTIENIGIIDAIAFRNYRSFLGLSRKDVQRGTGLGPSVVWRVEQTDKIDTMDPEQRVKIWNFLVAFNVEHPDGKPAKTPKPTTSQKVVEERDALHATVRQAIQMAETARAVAAENKRSTKAWDELLGHLRAGYNEA